MIFYPGQRDRAILHLDAYFAKGKTVNIENVPEAKTLQQNRYIWLVFTHVGFETGQGKDDVYLYYLDLFPRFKEVNHLGEVVLVRISMSHFSKEQLSGFIDEVVTNARQEGFDIPDPEDKKALEMYNFYRQKGLL